MQMAMLAGADVQKELAMEIEEGEDLRALANDVNEWLMDVFGEGAPLPLYSVVDRGGPGRDELKLEVPVPEQAAAWCVVGWLVGWLVG